MKRKSSKQSELFPDDRLEKVNQEIEKSSHNKKSKSSNPKISKPKSKSRKEQEKEGRSVGPILLVITIIISYLIILFN